jgi:hypothetical protein
MRKLEPHVRFLLRGSTLLIAMLTLWWFALRPPLLGMLRISEGTVLDLVSPNDFTQPLSVDASGDWNFHVLVRDSSGKQGAYVAVDFSIPRADVVLFTFSLPVFWAMALAASLRRPDFRALLLGTALVALVEVLSLLGNIEMNASGIAAQLQSADSGLARWMRDFGVSLIVGVIPFATPMLVAIALLPGLRSQIFTPSISVEPARSKAAGAGR